MVPKVPALKHNIVVLETVLLRFSQSNLSYDGDSEPYILQLEDTEGIWQVVFIVCI